MKKGTLGKFVSKKQAHINKGKGKKGKTEETLQKYCVQKVLMDKRAKKRDGFFEREDKKKTRKIQNRKKRRILKTCLSGQQKRKNLYNCRKITFGGSFFFLQKTTKTK